MIPSRVVADERERASGVPEELSRMLVRVDFSRLAVADYVISPEIAVERKAVKDLVSSVYDSRLFYQAARLSASFSKPYLLVEGDSKEVETLTKNLKSFYGALANVTIAYGLRMLYTANQKETAIAISELLVHARAKPASRPPGEIPQKPKSLAQQQLFLIASLPGVGTKLAEKLLSKYGTPRKVVGMTAGELSMMPGLGWKRAEKIRALLDTRYSKFEGGPDQERLQE